MDQKTQRNLNEIFKVQKVMDTPIFKGSFGHSTKMQKQLTLVFGRDAKSSNLEEVIPKG